MATVEEPILSRLNRLDNILRQLEEIRGGNKSPKSSCASTPSSGTLTSDGRGSSVDFSPNSIEKHCRPIDDVIVETELKGTLIERLVQVEERVLKLSMQLEEAEKMREVKLASSSSEKRPNKKGLKQLVKSCVTGRKKPKARTN